jgi:hypothetical protein
MRGENVDGIQYTWKIQYMRIIVLQSSTIFILSKFSFVQNDVAGVVGRVI